MTHLGDGPATPQRLRQVPTRLLNIAAMQADRLVSEGLARENARKWHYAVLVALAEAGPASQATLSTRTGIYRSDLVAVINELADQGFVERTPDAGDRRRNVITLTGGGRERMAHLDSLIWSLQDEVLAPLTPDERRQLIGLLGRLIDHHGNRSG